MLNVDLTEINVGEEPSVMELCKTAICHRKKIEIYQWEDEIEGEHSEWIVVKDKLGNA